MVAIGKPAPDFALENQNGDVIRLSHFDGQPIVIFAFPKANTFGCTKQACGFRDRFPDLELKKAAVFGVSTDSRFELNMMHRVNSLPYDLLSDPDHEMLEPYGAWGMDVMGVLTLPIIKRSYWGIDPDGILREMRIGIEPDASVEAALAFVEQF